MSAVDVCLWILQCADFVNQKLLYFFTKPCYTKPTETRKEQRMNYKRNTKYFTSPWIGKAVVLCWVLTAIGVAVVFLRISWLTYSLGGAIAIGSVLAGIILNGITVNDKEYDETCGKLTKAFREKFADFVYSKLNASNARNKAPVAVDEDKIALSRAFFYDQTTLSRVGQDGRRRSGRLLLSACYLDKQAVCIATQSDGLTFEHHDEVFASYPYATLAAVTCTEPDIPYAEYVFCTFAFSNGSAPVTHILSSDAETEKILSAVRARIPKE